MKECFIDIESYSEEALKSSGLYRYAAHPSTAIEIVGFKFQDLYYQWDVSKGPSCETLRFFKWLAEDPQVYFRAFNAAFERIMFWAVWGINIPRERWYCDMTMAYYYGFTGGLEDVGKQLGLPQDKVKMAEGRRLVQRFCKPRNRISKACRDPRWNYINDSDNWGRYLRYNLQDVIAEVAIHDKIHHLPMYRHFWREWRMQQLQMDRGVPVSIPRTLGAISIDEEYRALVYDHLQLISGLDNPNSRDQFLRWIRQWLPDLENLQAETLQSVVDDRTIDPRIREVVEFKQALNSVGSKKYYAVQRSVGADSRVRGMIQYYVAHTGRDGGRLLQLHNLPRPIFKDKEYDDLAFRLQQGDLKSLQRRWSEHSPLKLLSTGVRTVIEASPGHTFFVADYASVEVVVLACLTRCKGLLDVFREGKDPYKAFATYLYGVPYEEVTKEQRNTSKPPTLGAGYGLSWGGMDGTGGLIEYAAGMGVSINESLARKAIKVYRELYWEVVQFWDRVTAAFIDVIEKKQDRVHVNDLLIYLLTDTDGKEFLVVKLPSGRELFYYQPRVEYRPSIYDLHRMKEGEFIPPEEVNIVPHITYMGKSDKGLWGRTSTHRGKITENVVQAIARDLLYNGCDNVEYLNFRVIFTIHDELVSEVLIAEATPEQFNQFIYAVVHPKPKWAETWPISVSGYINNIYRKD